MNEQQARALKVDRLLDALAVVNHGSAIDPEVVRRMNDAAWAHLERLAGTKPASATTRAEVVYRLVRRADLAKSLEERADSVFDRLGR